MGARVYDPYTGTFLQTDPIPGADANAYGYTDGDPVNETDLTGKSPEIRSGNCVGSRQAVSACLNAEGRTRNLVPATKQQSQSIFDDFNPTFPEPGDGTEIEASRARNDQGWVLREPGSTGDANIIRVYDNGTMRYYNAEGQPIDPETGDPGSNADTHIDPSYRGPWKGVPKWWRGG